MHIPSEMLTGTVCPVSTGLAAVGVLSAVVALFRGRSDAPTPTTFALTSAVIFGLQMLNYPIWSGISGHVIGGALAATLLGIPAGILSMVLILTLQTLLFADGGLAMLGANILNMAILGTGLAGLLGVYLRAKTKLSKSSTVGIAAACSVAFAALALCVELAFSGQLSASIAVTLLGTHAVLAFVEALATVLLSTVLVSSTKERRPSLAFIGTISACLVLAPFASNFPDAFEWTMGRFGLLPEVPNFSQAPFIGYVAFGSEHVAAAIGLIAVAALGYTFALPLKRRAGARAELP